MDNIQLDHDSHKGKQKTYPLCILAHDIESPENIGSIFRIADAFGIEKIWLSGTSPVPPHPKIRKTSRSADKYVPFEYQEDPINTILGLKENGYAIISLEITSSSIDIRDLKIEAEERICLILGAVDYGISQGLLDISDKTIHIPMAGINSSMNVAVACGIASWEIINIIGRA